ncbi:MAG: hypothetical protein GY876_03080 [Planctomycetes bacterium]|nr:hypothetical protein [Planctomycetota bacterium]MCP4893950.1 hypothetical protein [Actinomycetales bacterium]
MNHEEIIGKLFYQAGKCDCDKCYEASCKAMMQMALSKDRPSAYRTALALSQYEDGVVRAQGFSMAVRTHNEIEGFRETSRGHLVSMNARELRAKRWALAIDTYMDGSRVGSL